jgi:hypothetical protein
MTGSIAVVKVNLTDGNAKRGPSLAFPILLLGA